MEGKTNVAGSGKLFAAIGVTYPAGSTLTCTNGTKTLTAKPKSEDNTEWVFAIPEEGTWTVTSTDKTDSTKTKSQSVSITEEGQFESMELSYGLVLFDGGEVVDWTARSANPTATITDTLYVYVNEEDDLSSITTTNKVDISGYNTLRFTIDKIEGSKNDRHFIGLSTNTAPMNGMGSVASSAVAYITAVKTGENVIDISKVTDGSYYVAIAQGGTASNPRGMKASKVWLA